MKLYLNWLPILISLCCIPSLAIAQEAPTEARQKKNTQATPEVIIDETRNQSNNSPTTETPTTETPTTNKPAEETSTTDPDKEPEKLELSALFPICPPAEPKTAKPTDQSEVLEKEEEEIETEKKSPKTDSAHTHSEEEDEASKLKTCFTAAESAYYLKLAEADRLFLAGEKVAARKLYQQLKEPWETEIKTAEITPAIYKVEELSPGGKVYWRTYQQGKQQQLSSKIFTPLKLIVAKQPDFIPGYITYSEELLAADRQAEANAVLEKAISIYPQEIPLLRAKLTADIIGERWLEASIASRQFALFNSDLPEAAEFSILADQYLKNYQDKVKEELTWNAVGNAITGTAGFALTGNIFGPISAIETTITLLQGEKKIGDRFSKRIQKNAPLLEDEAVLDYVRTMGNKIASVAGRDEFEYEFFVIMDDSLNAFALPGGKIFVNAGAIMNTKTEAELAGLLAHEVSHSVLSHGFQLITRGSLTANVAQYIPYVGRTAGGLLVRTYSRDMERQADIFGTRILVASGYASDGVRNLMATLAEINAQNEDFVEPPAWLSTHPVTNSRVEYIEELITSNNLDRYSYEGVEKHQRMVKKTQELWKKHQAEQKAKKDKDGRDEEEIDF